MERIVLASTSPRRKDLLTQIGLPFTIMPSQVEERLDELAGSPAEKAEQLAYAKARDVAAFREGLVLGADTIVVIGDEILGKPEDEEQARAMLSRLSGREHQVITAIALVDLGRKINLIAHETTVVRFRRLSAEMIEAYVESGEPMGKAGAYAIQGKGSIFVEGIRGCYPNVVGLPLTRLSIMLESIGLAVLGL